MCFMIFWKSCCRPSYCRECLLYWLRSRLGVQTSSLTVTKPMSSMGYFQLSMWRHIDTYHLSCSSKPSNYGSSHASGSKIQIQWLPAPIHNSRWMDKCEVCHWSIEAILILDTVDVRVAFSYIASHYTSAESHVQSYGWCDTRFDKDQDSLERRLDIHCEFSSTEAAQILRWSDCNDGYASYFCTYHRFFPEVAII
jgi:hypothetical protein